MVCGARLTFQNLVLNFFFLNLTPSLCRPKSQVGPKCAGRSTEWISLKIGTKGLLWSLNTNLIWEMKIQYGNQKLTLIEIRQFIRFFQILIRHIGSAISKFQILTSNSYSATQITPWYQFSSKSANLLDFSKFMVDILDQTFRNLEF